MLPVMILMTAGILTILFVGFFLALISNRATIELAKIAIELKRIADQGEPEVRDEYAKAPRIVEWSWPMDPPMPYSRDVEHNIQAHDGPSMASKIDSDYMHDLATGDAVLCSCGHRKDWHGTLDTTCTGCQTCQGYRPAEQMASWHVRSNRTHQRCTCGHVGLSHDYDGVTGGLVECQEIGCTCKSFAAIGVEVSPYFRGEAASATKERIGAAILAESFDSLGSEPCKCGHERVNHSVGLGACLLDGCQCHGFDTDPEHGIADPPPKAATPPHLAECKCGHVESIHIDHGPAYPRGYCEIAECTCPAFRSKVTGSSPP